MQLLLIEDDAKTAAFVERGFRDAGFAVTRAADGEEGLYLAREGAFDAIVADIMLPKLDGLSVVRALRAEGRRTPVIVLSARGSVESKVAGLEAGGDDYLAKPFSFAELLARVQALLRRAAASAAPEELRVGDLRMNLVTHRVERGGRAIDLPRLDYQLLEYLMRHAGRVVSRETILEAVWGYDFDPKTNVVETRVCRLREKIDRGEPAKLLRTVRGFGYVLG